MLAVTWTALAILATSLFGSLFYLGNRIDLLGAELRQEIGGLRQEMRAEIGGLRQEMRAEIGGLRQEMNGRFAEVNARLDSGPAGLQVKRARRR